MRSLTCVFVLFLGGCAIGSRAIAGLAAEPTDSKASRCGAVTTAVAVGFDGVVAGGIAIGDELSTFDKVAIGALAADAFIGGVMALRSCLDD